MEKYKISIRDLISFNRSEGSLGGGILNSTRAVLGTKEHKRIQESRTGNYLKEYSLKTVIERDGIILEVYGRADGIYLDMSPPVIEEIKTTTTNNISDDHMAQVKLYAYLYLIEKELDGTALDGLGIKLLYVNIKTGEERETSEYLLKQQLSDFFEVFIGPYLTYLIGNKDWSNKRDDSLKTMSFPFSNFRQGQRQFSINVFRSVRDSETLFARAPTGTGKSIATLFPTLKAMSEGACNKIFYLTSKTVGRITARDSINHLRRAGAKIKSVLLTAKEKICINEEFNCSPETCIYALDYYKKLATSLDQILKIDDFYEENLKELGRENNICPFELSLDLSNYCDIIVCDYNYVFDLRVYLKRYFDGGKQEFALLIDEAHNLPDRLRSSYSCEIIREDIPPLINISKPVSETVTKYLDGINSLLLKYLELNTSPHTINREVPAELIKLLRKFTLSVESSMLNTEYQGKKILLDWYFNTLFFIKLSELYTDGHIFLQLNRGGLGVSVEIVCNDPSILFTKMLLKSKSHIFFSATLTPLEYYENLLLKDREYKAINISSPFLTENLNIIIRPDIKTTYKERHGSYQNIAEIINSTINNKKGNYIVFFPSYLYMEEVRTLMDYSIHIQKSKMDESERKLYIDAFTQNRNILSFAILGGVFGEGIDLVGDKLIGVIIVGVGLPQISLKNDLMKTTFNYNYAYTFPGFNKVMQAVGRVIRDEEDRGVAVLIDHRFNTPLYRNLFPMEWDRLTICRNNESMKRSLESFWME